MSDNVETAARIKNYWEERAKENTESGRATTDDVYLRQLEFSTIVATIAELAISPGGSVLDVGCGDGRTTLEVAQAAPELRFVGVDYSENMIQTARRQVETMNELRGKVDFRVGDATNLEAACGDETFDVAMTDRCLINLPSLERQAAAIAQIARHTKPGGYYLGVENFTAGQENMNAMRRAMGLPDIGVRWHNLFFKEDEFVAATAPFFEIIAFKDFSSSYYFATRVVYSAMCQIRGEQPDYEHDIHRLAINLPWAGQHSPIRLALLRRKQQ
jgi:ubiquinone/menaquinone biosynthesis C-methylase UbiE